MANTSPLVPVSYNADGSTTEFDFTFKIINEDDVLVTLEDEDGNQTTLEKTTDYTVTYTENNDGTISTAYITTVSTYESPNKIIISRG
jgi:hypothetical protein